MYTLIIKQSPSAKAVVLLSEQETQQVATVTGISGAHCSKPSSKYRTTMHMNDMSWQVVVIDFKVKPKLLVALGSTR